MARPGVDRYLPTDCENGVRVIDSPEHGCAHDADPDPDKEVCACPGDLVTNYVTVPVGADAVDDGIICCRCAENLRGVKTVDKGHPITLDDRPIEHAHEAVALKVSPFEEH